MVKKFYITTAISYPNGDPHIGHAYEAIAADVFARFKHLDGYDVFFLTGTDDHGQKIYRTAKEQGVDPQEMTDRLSERFKDMCKFFNINYSRFIRTSETAHHEAVQAIWKKLEDRGDIYKHIYEGWYSVREEEFYTEAELIKNNKGEWETSGGSPVEWMKEDSYFFRLSNYQEKLLTFYAAHPDFILPKSRYNEVLSFVQGGLKDLSISRTSFDWGVPTPTEDKAVVYVWLDALTNYLTGCGYPDENSAQFDFWSPDIHFIGKDILRFHTVYWPAFLMSAKLALPKKVFAHGMILTGEGEKMSKSLKNTVDPFEQAERYGVDAFRYFLLANTPFGQDGVYSEEQMVARLNADLANNLGNLAQRCLTMVEKNFSSKAPKTDKKFSIDNALEKIHEAMDSQAFHLALGYINEIVSETNRYFAAEKPWELEGDAQGAVLGYVIEALRQTGILLLPFMPDKMNALLDLLAVPLEHRNFACLRIETKSGAQLPEPKPIFPRYKKEA
jgi:methionyl-tRNA synthetase